MYYQRSTEGITRLIMLEDTGTNEIIWYGSCEEFSNLNMQLKKDIEIIDVLLRTEDIEDYVKYEKELKIQKGLDVILTLAKMKMLRKRTEELIREDIIEHGRKEELCRMV